MQSCRLAKSAIIVPPVPTHESVSHEVCGSFKTDGLLRLAVQDIDNALLRTDCEEPIVG